MSNFVTSPDTSAGDWGGVHNNSGILNKAAFLITDGQKLQHPQRARHGPGEGAAALLQRAGEPPARQQRFL